MPTKFSIKFALASHLDWDVDEVESFRYQSTKTPVPVYSVDDDYLTATKIDKLPRENTDYKWEKVNSWVTKQYGWVIWRKKDEEE